VGWLFAQVWILCVAAFLAGAAVTWLVFVPPRRGRSGHGHGVGHAPARVWAAYHRSREEDVPPPEPPKPPPPRPVDPALAELDSGRIPRARTGTAASEALDALNTPKEERDKD
jgi:hypothetical protein